VSRSSCAASTLVTAHTPKPQRSARRNDKLPAWLL
jgi:hypothetical protein